MNTISGKLALLHLLQNEMECEESLVIPIGGISTIRNKKQPCFVGIQCLFY